MSFELICHHTYAAFGVPVDLSPYDSHGRAFHTDFIKNGIKPGSGAQVFARLQSRIIIPPSNAWRPLTGLKVEATIRRDTLHNHKQTIIAGHQSFSFSITRNFLFASFHGPSTVPGQTTDGLNAEEHAIDPAHLQRLPFNEWITVGFLHDGLNTMELYLNGKTIARRSGLLGGIPPVGPLGIGIGNEYDQDDQFLCGAIDDIKVWRLNPYEMITQFFSRPVKGAARKCQDDFLNSLTAVLKENPDCAHELVTTVNRAMGINRRAIAAKGPSSRERFNKLVQAYRKLWLANKLHDPAMAKVIHGAAKALQQDGIQLENDPALAALVQSACFKKVMAACKPLDCDPQVAGLLRLLIENFKPDTAPN